MKNAAAVFAPIADEALLAIARARFDPDLTSPDAAAVAALSDALQRCRRRLSEYCLETRDPQLRQELLVLYDGVGALCELLE